MGASRKSSLLAGMGANFIGAVIPLLVTLFTVPIYLSHVGAARYGVILVAWSLLGYMGFMDLGISRATTNAMAKVAEDDADDIRSRIFWSSLIINGCLGMVGSLIIYGAGSFLFRNVVHVPPALHGEIVVAMPILAGMLPVTLMMGVGIGTAEAHQRFGILNLLQATGLILGQGLPLLLVLYHGPSLVLILGAMLAVRAATFVGVTAYAAIVAGVAWRPVVDVSLLKSMLSFGGWVTVTNLVSPIMTNIDQFVIGALRSVAMVPFYGVPMNIIVRTQIIPTVLTRTLFPIFSRVQKDEGRNYVGASLCHLATIVTLVYVSGIFFAHPLLSLWLGEHIAPLAAPVFRILALGAWSNCLAFVVFSALQGQGRPRAPALIHASEVLPYLALIWFMVDRFGVVGAAAAWSIRATVDSALLMRAYGIERKLLAALVPGAVTLVATFVIVEMLQPGFVGAMAGSALVCTAFLIVNAFSNEPYRAAVEMLLRRLASSRFDRRAS